MREKEKGTKIIYCAMILRVHTSTKLISRRHSQMRIPQTIKACSGTIDRFSHSTFFLFLHFLSRPFFYWTARGFFFFLASISSLNHNPSLYAAFYFPEFQGTYTTPFRKEHSKILRCQGLISRSNNMWSFFLIYRIFLVIWQCSTSSMIIGMKFRTSLIYHIRFFSYKRFYRSFLSGRVIREVAEQT